jgi:hypothetical protein
MYNRPMCGRSTGTYTNLGDLQRDIMGVKSHPTKKKGKTVMKLRERFFNFKSEKVKVNIKTVTLKSLKICFKRIVLFAM